jgi:hypothetical protein
MGLLPVRIPEHPKLSHKNNASPLALLIKHPRHHDFELSRQYLSTFFFKSIQCSIKAFDLYFSFITSKCCDKSLKVFAR